MRNGICRESHTRTCHDIEELRRICHEENDRARQAIINDLSLHQKRDPSNVKQLLTQIQYLQNKVNSLADARDFHDPETSCSSGATYVPSQPSNIPSPEGMLSRDSGLRLDTRSSMSTSGIVFERPTCSGRTILSSLREFTEFCIIFLRIDIRICHGTWKCDETRSAELQEIQWYQKGNERGTTEFVNTCTTLPKRRWIPQS